MALFCHFQIASCLGPLLGRENDNSVSGDMLLVPDTCHMFPLRLPTLGSPAPSSSMSMLPKTQAWSHSLRVSALRRNREGPQWQGQQKSLERDSSRNSVEANHERTENGAAGTIAFADHEKNATNEDRTHEKLAASSIQRNPSNDTSASDPESTFIVDKDFLEPAKESFLSFVRESGSEIERVSVDMTLQRDGKEIRDQKLGFFVEEGGHGQERLIALENILATLPQSEEDLSAREVELLAFPDKLINESAMNQETYARSQEALNTAEGMVVQLKTEVGQLNEDVATRDALLRLLQSEASLSSHSLQRAAKSLVEAETRIRELERQVQKGEESLYEERDKVTAAVTSAALFEQAVRVAEGQVTELTAEIISLKTLANSGRRAEQLNAQLIGLEAELKARDNLLLEIKEETKRSTEALKLAAKIKQDLNDTKQREVQLTQALESSNALVKELQTELLQNLRSLRAEQALKQMEKMLQDARQEVQFLRKGVEERDKALHVMKDEVDLNIGLLSGAARDREDLNTVKVQMEQLKEELGSTDAKLTIIREEMASIINLARRKENTGSKHDSSCTAASSSKSSVQKSKPKKKAKSRKQTGLEPTLGPSQEQC